MSPRGKQAESQTKQTKPAADRAGRRDPGPRVPAKAPGKEPGPKGSEAAAALERAAA